MIIIKKFFCDSHLNTLEMVRVWGNYHAISSGNASFTLILHIKTRAINVNQGPFKYISKYKTLDNIIWLP